MSTNTLKEPQIREATGGKMAKAMPKHPKGCACKSCKGKR